MTKKILKMSKYKTSVLQGRFEFSMPSGSVSIATEHPRERLLMELFGVTLAVLFIAYLYLVSASILNVITRKEVLAKVDSLTGQIGVLEQHYLDLASTITPGEGSALGLAPVRSTQYVYRPGTVGALDRARAGEAATIAHNAN